MYETYAIVTPVKNEEKYLPLTIRSVTQQTILPDCWIIINDGSTDRTSDIIDDAVRTYPWIRTIKNAKCTDRAPGGEGILHLGIEQLNMAEYRYFARIDGDVSFESHFFETIFTEFDHNPKLGICGGVCYNQTRKGLREEKHPRFHTRGATKIYRTACYQEIGGLQSCLGWDGADELKAHMLGWQTYSLPQLRVMHHRHTQSANGVLNGKVNLGKAAFYLGYHPLFLMARAIRHMAKTPYVLGGLYLLAGYVGGYVKRQPQIQDRELIAFVRTQQWRRMLGRNSMWK
jgi:glycosyltransferase involved in cell wall biosynthesis